MTKKELKSYLNLQREVDKLEGTIKKLEREADNVPTVKTKVQSSQKEFPYIETHVTVDAPEPVRFSKIKATIVLKEQRIDEALDAMFKIETFIHTIPDARTRAILEAVAFTDKSQKDIAIEFDLTEGRIAQIIEEVCEKSFEN